MYSKVGVLCYLVVFPGYTAPVPEQELINSAEYS